MSKAHRLPEKRTPPYTEAFREYLTFNHITKMDINAPIDPSSTAIFASLTTQGTFSGDLPDEIVFMPIGDHEISAKAVSGGSFFGKVHVDAQAYAAIAQSFAEIQASGRPTFLDFDHEEGAASAWVKSFRWDPSRGVMVKIEWSDAGRAALTGKSYYSFSPSFSVERETGRVVGLLSGGRAAGGLVNAPAFAAMPALIAAKAASPSAWNESEPGSQLPGRNNYCGMIFLN